MALKVEMFNKEVIGRDAPVVQCLDQIIVKQIHFAASVTIRKQHQDIFCRTKRRLWRAGLSPRDWGEQQHREQRNDPHDQAGV